MSLSYNVHVHAKKCLEGQIEPSLLGTEPDWVKNHKSSENMLLSFNFTEGITAKDWITKNGWGIEEWNQDDHLVHILSRP